MIFHTEERELVLDLTGDLATLKDKPFIIKEGCQYRIKIEFKIQNEVVSGLRYVDAVYRKGVRVERNNFMLGSYGPKAETQVAQTPWQEVSNAHYTGRKGWCVCLFVFSPAFSFFFFFFSVSLSHSVCLSVSLTLTHSVCLLFLCCRCPLACSHVATTK